MIHVLINPLSTNCVKKEEFNNYIKQYKQKEEICFYDLTKLNSAETVITRLNPEDELVLCGGDGSLNRFVNSYDFTKVKNNIYLFRCGNGNDFLRDVAKDEEKLVRINDYIVNLPTVEVADKTMKFINGIGFGIDGMVCYQSDLLKAKGKKNINYTTLSIKLLLTKYKPVNARVVVDGEEFHFKKVFIASSMNGKYYGGGMKVAPDQDRKGEDLTICVWHKAGRIKTLMLFPKIFTGEHLKKKERVFVKTGKNIEVYYDRPTDLQVDGETFHNVLNYKVTK